MIGGRSRSFCFGSDDTAGILCDILTPLLQTHLARLIQPLAPAFRVEPDELRASRAYVPGVARHLYDVAWLRVLLRVAGLLGTLAHRHATGQSVRHFRQRDTLRNVSMRSLWPWKSRQMKRFIIPFIITIIPAPQFASTDQLGAPGEGQRPAAASRR